MTGRKRRGKSSTFPYYLMRLSHFVTISSIMLCGWLALTFVSEVPAQSYPKLEKYVRKSHPKPQGEESRLAATDADHEASRISVSQ